jgi:hypothetical protein
MRSILIIVFVFVSISAQSFAQAKTIVDVRNLAGNHSEQAADRLNELLTMGDFGDSLEIGYRSVALFIRAKYSYSPLTKVKYFNKGRDMLEKSLTLYSGSTELHYLRFCIQTNVPFFLNYSSNIEEDKKIILLNWNNISDQDLKWRIKNFLMRSEYCSESDKMKLNNG